MTHSKAAMRHLMLLLLVLTLGVRLRRRRNCQSADTTATTAATIAHADIGRRTGGGLPAVGTRRHPADQRGRDQPTRV